MGWKSQASTKIWLICDVGSKEAILIFKQGGYVFGTFHREVKNIYLYVHSKYTTAWDVPVLFLEVIMINDDVSMLTAKEERQILICKMFCACTTYGTILYIKCIGLSWIKYDLQLAFIVPDSLVDLHFGPIRNPTAALLFTRIWRKTVIH